ncbi:hypothetical protein TKK_0017149 [Trichogramma kaykai]
MLKGMEKKCIDNEAVLIKSADDENCAIIEGNCEINNESLADKNADDENCAIIERNCEVNNESLAAKSADDAKIEENCEINDELLAATSADNRYRAIIEKFEEINEILFAYSPDNESKEPMEEIDMSSIGNMKLRACIDELSVETYECKTVCTASGLDLQDIDCIDEKIAHICEYEEEIYDDNFTDDEVLYSDDRLAKLFEVLQLEENCDERIVKLIEDYHDVFHLKDSRKPKKKN